MKKDLIPAVVSFIAIGAVCFGLAAARPPVAPQKSPALAGGTRVVAADDKVIMHVNGEPVTEREFSGFIAEAPEQMQFYYMTPEGRRVLAEEIVKLKALEQEGRRLGVDQEPEVATRLHATEMNIIAGSALRKIIGRPDEQRLRAAYEKEKGQLESTELSHILIAYAGGAVPPRRGPAPSEAQAMQQVQRIMAALKAGADFGNVARTASDDVQSAANGGSIGLIQPGSLPPEIQAVTAALRPGEISAPVKSEFGIHIFKAGERKAQPFEAVREALLARVQRDDAAAAMDRLQKAAKVELDPKFFVEPKQEPAAPKLQRQQP